MQELIERLHGAAKAKVGGTAMINADALLKTADMLESQAAEIEKYKALCDQMATVMTNAVEHRWPYLDDMRSLIEAWRAMK